MHPVAAGARALPDVLHEHGPARGVSRHVARVSRGEPAAVVPEVHARAAARHDDGGDRRRHRAEPARVRVSRGQSRVAAARLLRHGVRRAGSDEVLRPDRSRRGVLLRQRRARHARARAGARTRLHAGGRSAAGLQPQHPRQPRRHRPVRRVLGAPVVAAVVVCGRRADPRILSPRAGSGTAAGLARPRDRLPCGGRRGDLLDLRAVPIEGRGDRRPHLVAVLPHRLRREVRAAAQRQPDRAPDHGGARRQVEPVVRLLAAAPAAARRGRPAVRERARHRRGIGQRPEPRAGVRRQAHRRRRDRSGDPEDRPRRSPGSPVPGSARQRAHRRRPQLPARGRRAVRPDHLCARRLARAAQRLQQHPARELHVHARGLRRRQARTSSRAACSSSTTTSGRDGSSRG